MKRTAVLVLMSLNGLLALCSAGERPLGDVRAPAGNLTFRFTGKVVTTNDLPVEGAIVELYQYSASGVPMANVELKERVTADSNGVFHARVPVSQALVVARKAGFAPSWANMWADADERIVLTKATNLVGVVVDEASLPVSHAEVCVWYAIQRVRRADSSSEFRLASNVARELFATKAGADGRFRIEGFPANGSAFLSARAPGKVFREPQRRRYSAETGAQPGSEVRLALEPAGSLAGIVATESGASVPGVRLSLEPEQREQEFCSLVQPVESKADGSFAFNELAAGDYWVRADFGAGNPPQWAADHVLVSVEAGQATSDLKVTASRGGLLEVTVFSAEHRPLAGASVTAWLEGRRFSAVSSDAGRAVLRLRPGQYGLSATKEGLPSQYTLATVEDETTNSVEIQFKAPLKVVGTIRDPTGKAAAGVRISKFPRWGPSSDVQTRTDMDGRFELAWDPPAHDAHDLFTLLALDRARNMAVALEIDESTRMLDLQLQPALVIAGQVADTRGQPLTNVTVGLSMRAGPMNWNFGDRVKPDLLGAFKITCLPKGRRYGVSVLAEAYAPLCRRFKSRSLLGPTGSNLPHLR